MGKSLKERTQEIAQNVLRRGYSLQNTEVFDLTPDIIDSVEFDQDALRKTVRKIWGHRRLNHLLGLLGFTLVPTGDGNEKTLQEVDTEQNRMLRRMLRVNAEKLEEALKKIAESLVKTQEISDEEKASLNASYEEIRRDFRDYREKIGHRIDEYQIRREAVAKRIQHLMALRRKASGELADYEDLSSILSDLGMSAVWPESLDENRRAELFIVFKVSDPQNEAVKPCIKAGDELLAQGEVIELVE